VADRTRELAMMNSILSVASRSLDIQEILEDSLKITVEQMGFEMGAAFMHLSDPATPVLISQRGFEGVPLLDLIKLTRSTARLSRRWPIDSFFI